MSFLFSGEIKSLTIGLLFWYLMAAPVSSVFAVKSENPNVCPAGNVKYEAGSGYEYNDGSGGVTVLGGSANWGPTAGYEITQVCIKAGQDLFYPNTNSGTFSTPKKDISHIVLYTKVSEDSPNSEKPPTNGIDNHCDEDTGEVLGGVVLPETGANLLGLILAALSLKVGFFLRKKIPLYQSLS